MKSLTKTLGVGLLGLTMSGFSPNTDKILEGIPISVAASNGYGDDYMATVLDVNGRYILAYGDGNSLGHVKAEALIKSEIVDGDNETIRLKGSYYPRDQRKEFRITDVYANGHHVMISRW